MKWDKPNFEKKKQPKEQAQLQKDAEVGRKVQDFLMGQYRGRIEWPDPNLYIGVDFEIGGTYENYGYGVYYYTQPNGDLRLVASGITLLEALEKATKYFRNKLKDE